MPKDDFSNPHDISPKGQVTLVGAMKMVALSATVMTAIGAAAVFIADALPYAKIGDHRALAIEVADNTVKNQRRHIDDLTRQIYAARRACRDGDREGCEHAEDLRDQIRRAHDDLSEAVKRAGERKEGKR